MKCGVAYDEMPCELEAGHVGIHSNWFGQQWYGNALFEAGWVQYFFEPGLSIIDLFNLGQQIINGATMDDSLNL